MQNEQPRNRRCHRRHRLSVAAGCAVGICGLVPSTVAQASSTVGRSTIQAVTAQNAVIVRSAPTSLTFPTPRDGFVAEANYLVHTSNSGRSWTTIRPHLGSIEQVQFLTQNDGVLLTRKGLFSTTDGGSTWLAKSRRPTIRWMTFITPSRGWALSRDSLWATDDSGTSWRRIDTPVVSSEACFANGKSGWIIGSSHSQGPEVVWGTSNGGTTWLRRPIETQLVRTAGASPYGVRILSCAAPATIWALIEPPGAGYAGGEAYGVYYSSDGGRHWRVEGVNPGRDGLPAAPRAQPEALESAGTTTAYVAASCGGCGRAGTTSVGVMSSGHTKWHVVNLESAGFSDRVLMDFPRTWLGWVLTAHLSHQSYRLKLFETRDQGTAWIARSIFRADTR